jgi:hypothetical protein
MMTAPTKNYMASIGAILVDHGFPILPIQPGTKKPGIYLNGRWRDYSQWSRHCERLTTDHEVDIWGNYPEASIGIATGVVVGVDIDVLASKEVSDKIEALAREMLGDTPALRVGKAPKRLLVYRAAIPFGGFKYPRIEILGRGQQFVAYGIHPDTQKPYEWPDIGLTDLSISELPVITEEQARAFAEKAVELIPPEMRPATLVAGLAPHVNLLHQGDLKGTYEAIESALASIANVDLDYDSWTRIGLAIKGALGDEGLELFKNWSAQSHKNNPKQTMKNWKSFNPSRIGAGTIYRLAFERGWVPDPHLQLNGTAADDETHPASEFLNSLKIPEVSETESKKLQPPPPKPLPEGWDNVGGVLQEMMHLMITTAKRPQPVLALGASLCTIGALMGRKYKTESNIRSNLYVVGIAESGAGKNHSRMVINELLMRANLQTYLGGNKIASGPGLIAAIQRHPAILFMLDEFGMFLSAAMDKKRSPRYLTEIVDLMTELFTTSGTTYWGVEYANSQHNKDNTHKAIHQPCVCIYGTTTPVHFWEALQASNVADGSLARFLVLESQDDFPDSNVTFGHVDPSQELLDKLILIHQGGGALDGNLTDLGALNEVIPSPRTVPMHDEAIAHFRNLDSEILMHLRKARGTGFTSILARIEENATKLALIRAVSRDPVDPIITFDDAQWGINLAQHCANFTIYEATARISENVIESNHKRALQILKNNGANGMAKSEFTRKTQFIDHRQRDSVLRTLIDSGLIEVSILQNKGRPTSWIKCI